MATQEIKIIESNNGKEIIELELVGYSAQSVCDIINSNYKNIKYLHIKPIVGSKDEFKVHIETCDPSIESKNINQRGWYRNRRKTPTY